MTYLATSIRRWRRHARECGWRRLDYPVVSGAVSNDPGARLLTSGQSVEVSRHFAVGRLAVTPGAVGNRPVLLKPARTIGVTAPAQVVKFSFDAAPKFWVVALVTINARNAGRAVFQAVL